MKPKLSNLECKIKVMEYQCFNFEYELIYFIKHEMYKLNFNVRVKDLILSEQNKLKREYEQLQLKKNVFELRQNSFNMTGKNPGFSIEEFALNEKERETNQCLLNGDDYRDIDIIDYSLKFSVLNGDKKWCKLVTSNENLQLNLRIKSFYNNEDLKNSYSEVVNKLSEISQKVGAEYLRRFTPKSKAVVF